MAKKKEEKKPVLEREHIVPLKKVYERTKTKRAKKAINVIKAFMKKHFRISEEDVLISNKVNELVWERGMEKPLRKIKVKVIVAEGKANVFLPNEKMPEKKEKKEKKKEEEKTEEQKEAEKEMEKKKEEKREMEKEAAAAAIKRGNA
jgi:large subunit ribosomal protein L31e